MQVLQEHHIAIGLIRRSKAVNVINLTIGATLKNGQVEHRLKVLLNAKKEQKVKLLIGFLAWLDMTIQAKDELVKSIIKRMTEHKEQYDNVIYKCNRNIDRAVNEVMKKRAQVG